ncbi:Glyoxylase, beta-lactamase superfamily II [Kosakonia arachidis]|uniref:Glyoxylase, beta-lactamase superfamily II n=1 Tax=Kosakonia arachidis TaxID=551989 RepID=A0A1I7CAA6_9ENTR|nr:MBL fold metallo-hydrolase [Kosakonia arachidis]SFT96327.1 Glyoxylase, beta-lactamase superfamily II [Kosakonia arachidis]
MNALTFPSRQIGDFQVTAVSDGNMSASLDLLSGITTEDAARLQHHAGIAEPGNIHINGYLIRGRGRTILVDAGTGGLNNAGGQLKANLAAIGISHDEVDTVLLTHCHPDHIGGLLDAEKRPVFQHAELLLHHREADYWSDDEKRKIASERGQRNFMLARQTLEAYARNVRFFSEDNIFSEDDIAEGISAVWLPGHTPGHTGFRIDAKEKSLLIWGDIVHYPHIQTARPAVSILFDVDPALAKETREKILAQAVREKLLIAGMHLGQAGFTTVSMADTGYCLSRSAF